ncbi:MAG: peptidyl-prolyl cis-trans isomerase [Nitrospirae bacterium]|nr:peptidyl-prolyl cis-trans isomerase [Nitrospirota bacterium]
MTKHLWHRAIVILLLGAGIQPLNGGASTLDRIVAVVNGEIITLSDLQSAAAQAQLGLLGLSPDETAPRRPSSQPEVLDRLIDQKLQLQTARRKGVAVGPEELERAVEEVKQKNGMTTDEALQKALQKEHTNLHQYKNGLRDQIMILKLVNREVRAGVVLSDEDLRSYYEEHSDRFLIPIQYRLRQILIPISDRESAPAAEQTARSVADQLKNGVAFQTLARRYSNGPEAKDPGNLGLVRADQMLPEIRRAIESLKPGEFSPPIRTPAGFHLLQLDEIQPPAPRPLGEVRTVIQEILFQERSAELYEKWLKDLRTSAQVEIKF